MALAPWEKQLSNEQKAAAAALGINNVNKQDELTRINNYIAAAQKSQSDPVYQQAAKNLGITNYNSVNDYAQVVNRMANPPAPTTTTVTKPSIDLSSFIGPQGTAGILGPNAVKRAQDYGLSIGLIKQLAAEQSLGFSEDAFSAPTPAPTTTETAPPPVPEYQGPTMEDFSGLIEQMQIQSQQQIDALMQGFQQQEAQRLAEIAQLREEQRSMMINQARAVSPANLQLGIGYNQNKLAGTEGFKVRPKSTTPAPVAFSAPTLATTAATLFPSFINV
jgi:DNA-binding transcriptional MerR regulator